MMLNNLLLVPPEENEPIKHTETISELRKLSLMGCHHRDVKVIN